jgi:hypothetical protein
MTYGTTYRYLSLNAIVLFTNNQEYEDPMEQDIQEPESPMRRGGERESHEGQFCL